MILANSVFMIINWAKLNAINQGPDRSNNVLKGAIQCCRINQSTSIVIGLIIFSMSVSVQSNYC
eukprot:scaffold40962_cov562-Skeletonema_marinoi.AAC.1